MEQGRPRSGPPRFSQSIDMKILGLLATLLIAIGVRAQFSTTPLVPSSAAIDLQERVMMALQIYHVISTFFPGLSQEKFDAAYRQYLATILRTEDRREFDLASLEFVADLHDGHSWFYDKWLDQTYAQPIGFLAYPLLGKWTVVRSVVDSVRVGDVITAVDGSP